MYPSNSTFKSDGERVGGGGHKVVKKRKCSGFWFVFLGFKYKWDM